MTRIVAGAARGRRIAVPPGEGTRPTSDRAREALFATLGTLLDLDGARVLDLYAGSGAVGLEALSRGAALATMIECDRRAGAIATANAGVVGLPGADVRVTRVERVARVRPDRPYDLVFADPPYAMTAEAVHRVLADLLVNRWIAPDAVVAVERSSRSPVWTWPEGLEEIRSRGYGEGTLWYGRRP